jgi:hypothetical protein
MTFSGFWFKVPDELDTLMGLPPAQLKVFLVVCRAEQRDRNKGLLSVRQIAERARLSYQYACIAANALCGRGLVAAEKSDGRTTLYGVPVQWKGGPNCSSTVEQSGGNCSSTGEQHCSTTGEQHLESLESSSKRDKKAVVSVGEQRRAAVPEPRTPNPKSLSKIHDDDKPKALWASDRDELIALIRESTGELPDRKLLRQISDGVEGRGGTLRAYLDDIRPRIRRLKRKPGFGFFYEHARTWGGSQQQAPEPQQQPPKCSCRFGQIEIDGEWRPCPECKLGREVDNMNAQIAMEKEAAANGEATAA